MLLIMYALVNRTCFVVRSQMHYTYIQALDISLVISKMAIANIKHKIFPRLFLGH